MCSPLDKTWHARESTLLESISADVTSNLFVLKDMYAIQGPIVQWISEQRRRWAYMESVSTLKILA